MANSLLTIDQITRKALQIFTNSLVLSRNVNKQYDSSFAQEGAKIGSALRIRLPNRYLVTDGAALGTQDTSEQKVTLEATTQKHVAVNFTTAEMALSLDDFAERILRPAMVQLASSVDADLANAYKEIAQSVGTPGTTPATSRVLLDAAQKLNEAAAPMNPRYVTVNPGANASLVEGMKGLFHPGGTISKQFKTGSMGEDILGFSEIAMSQSIKSFTTGSRTAGGTTSAAVSTEGATTISITGAGNAKTIKIGDVFTVADCNAVNPLTRESTGSLKQFVATADVTLNGSGAGDITVAPIYSSTHKLATVDSLPGNSKTVTFVGAASTAYPQNLVYHKDAIALATADLVLPKGVDMASRAVHDGISLRIVRQYDVNNDRMPCRVDVLYGYKVIRPEAAVRLWG